MNASPCPDVSPARPPPSVRPPSPFSGTGDEAEMTYLSVVESTLVQEIQRLRTTLTASRHDAATPAPSRRLRSPALLPGASASDRHRHRVISVSLRLPTKEDRESVRQQLFDFSVPPKGMFPLQAASSACTFVWVGLAEGAPAGSAGFDKLYGGERERVARTWRADGQSSAGRQPNIVAVALQEPAEKMKRLLNFSEDTLYKVLHYDYSGVFSDIDGELDENYEAYKQVNEQFAQCISEIYEDGDLVWIHNHHLMLLPQLIRERLWYAKIGFFLYTQFPSVEVFRILPFRQHLLRGILGSDLVGFYSYNYSKQFVSACQQLLGLDGTPSCVEADPLAGRRCDVNIYPAGIDVKTLQTHVSSKIVKTRVAQLRQQFSHRKVIVGVDRLDDMFSGIPLTLLAFEKLLENNPELSGQIVLVQVAMLPTQSRKVLNRPERSQINEIVARINASFGTLVFSPVHYITSELDPSELHSLMSVGHVCIVSKVRDGMGLVPHEWTVCQHDGYKGPIVLSEFSGSARSFSTALHVNPWDVDQVAERLKEALEMGEKEREVKNAIAYGFVSQHTSALWGFNFLEDLGNVKGAEHGDGSLATPALDPIALIKAYKASSSLSAAPSPHPSSATLSALGSQQFGTSLGSDTMLQYATRGPLVTMSPPTLSVGHMAHVLNSNGSFGRMKSGTASDGDRAMGSATSSSSSVVGSSNTPLENSRNSRRLWIKKKLFILDYEGTMSNFQPLPEANAPANAVKMTILSLLEACRDNCVLILSGRDREYVEEWFGDMDVFLAAEDGCFLRRPGDSDWIPLFQQSSKYDALRRGTLEPADSITDLVGMAAEHAVEYQPLSRSILDIVSSDAGTNGTNGGTNGEAKGGQLKGGHHPLVRPVTKKGSTSSMGSFHANESSEAEEEIAQWKEPVLKVMRHFEERTPGARVEEGDASVTWHYVDADKTFGRSQARDLYKQLESFLLQNLKMEVVAEEGKNRWVKVHPVGVNKAAAVFRTVELVRDFGGRSATGDDVGRPRIDFVLCVGDDRADECMFDILREEQSRCELGINSIVPRIFSVRVGSTATGAQFSLESPEQVLELLGDIVKRSHGGSNG